MTVSFTLDGRAATAPAGIPLLDACLRNGAKVPYFCWHPGLSVAGSCRMCLVMEAKAPRPIISCGTQVAEGMVVDTQGAEVRKAREAVLEFLLINHPLDCPVCDKAGECVLQDHAFAHGPDRGRFVEPKEIRHTKPLGPKVRIWGNRCILCTRCIRFLDEISGTSELCVVERGDRAIIDVFPGRPLENPMSLNVVDVCPVGALISEDFLYQARVWTLKAERTLCAGCARGCNIEAEALEGAVKRLRPRPNPEVNGHWMCDSGRLEYRYVNAGDRLAAFRSSSGEAVPADRAILEIVSPLRALREAARSAEDFRRSVGSFAESLAGNRDAALAGMGKVLRRSPLTLAEPGGAVLAASLWMTNEELFVLRRIAQAAGAGLFVAARPPGPSRRFPGGFTISADKNPNRRGAEAILGRETVAAGLAGLSERLAGGRTLAALLVGGWPGFAVDPALERPLAGVQTVAILHFAEVPLSAPAARLAGATFAEKDGTFTNEDGRVQRLRRLIPSPGEAMTDLEILQRIAKGMGIWDEVLSAEGVFRLLASEVGAFAGMTYRGMAEGGMPL